MRWFAQRSRTTIVFWALLVLSAVSLNVSSQWSNRLKHFMQLLVPFQSPLYRTGWTAAQHLSDPRGTSEPAAQRADDRERQALENAVVGLNSHLEQVQLENGRLKGLRDRYIPPGVRLVSAQVVVPDISGWRDTLLLGRGSGLESDKKIRRNDPVASRVFLNAGEDSGTRVGHLVLAREFLLGEIDQVSPFISRARLFSDIGARKEVRLGRNVQTPEGARFFTVQYPCTLLGRGHGEMIIEHVPERFISEDARAPADVNAIRAGDLVVSVPNPPALPSAMVIGSVRSTDPAVPCFERDPRKPLVVTIHVKAALTPDEISDVFVVAGGPDR